MEPKVPDDIYKTHLENNSEWKSLCLLDDNHCYNFHVHDKCFGTFYDPCIPQGSEAVAPRWTLLV